MTGEAVDTDVIDGAINEMVVTGEIGDETGKTDEIAGMVAYLKDQVGGKISLTANWRMRLTRHRKNLM